MRLSNALTLILVPSLLGAQLRPADTSKAASLGVKLPVDPKVRIGTLPNGLRYYIRQNAKPENRAELRLVVNAGSILEKDDQLGYAHFVEHTAFNGTRNFAKNDLVKYLQSIGVRFGADLNAYTSFDETVYILPIPTDTARIVNQAFTILEDWAHGQVLDSAEVIAERGVVLEEWRGRKGAGDRMLQQFLPILFKNSQYANRLPIGTDKTILAATSASLRPFYRDWYRPDLMAVVAVGDFNPDTIEAKIKHHFTKLRKPANAPARVEFPIPGNQAPLIAIASDKEAISTNVSLMFKLRRESSSTVGDYRRGIMEQLYISMLNGRLSEITQKPDAPFIGAGASKEGFVGRELEPFSLSAAVKDGGVERGLEALLIEAKRVDQFGFLQSELDRAKTNMLRGYERAYAERDKSNSDLFADEYVRNYLQGEEIPGIAYEYNTVQALLPGVTLQEVNRLGQGWITDENRVVIVQAPIKEGVAIPTEANILAVFDKAVKAPVVAYTETLSGEALVDNLAAAGSVVSSRPRPLGVSEWTLSNGAKVLIKPTDFKADQILFSAYSPGGISLANDADFISAALAPQIVALSGLGKYNRVDLNKKLAGKAASVGASWSDATENLGGSASPKDLETLMQQVYLHFTGARLDTTAFAAFKQNAAPFIANRGADPNQVYQDTIQVTLSQNDYRARPLTPATFAEINGDKAIAFFRERYANAGDFTFMFVGNVDTVALKPLVQTYLASLPNTGRVDAPRVTGKGLPRGVVQKTVRKGVEQKATTNLYFTGSCTYSPEKRMELRALIEVFQIRLIESLREKLGGTYSPGVQGVCARTPRQDYQVRIQFQSSPENVETLTQATFALIDSIKTHGPTQADVDKVKAEITRSREVETKQNSYWLANIAAREQAGEDIGGLGSAYDDMVRKLTAAQLQAAARQYFNTANYARFVLLPEK
jgi:zinc protease